jgi:hypothetical protein
MLIEMFVEMMTAFAEAALEDHERVVVEHVGAPARYLVHDVEGKVIQFPRAFRLLMEPVDHVIMRSLPECVQRWTIQ